MQKNLFAKIPHIYFKTFVTFDTYHIYIYICTYTLYTHNQQRQQKDVAKLGTKRHTKTYSKVSWLYKMKLPSQSQEGDQKLTITTDV